MVPPVPSQDCAIDMGGSWSNTMTTQHHPLPGQGEQQGSLPRQVFHLAPVKFSLPGSDVSPWTQLQRYVLATLWQIALCPQTSWPSVTHSLMSATQKEILPVPRTELFLFTTCTDAGQGTMVQYEGTQGAPA